MPLTSYPTDEEMATIVGATSIYLTVFYILLVVAGWKILKKAGEPGWKILIPIYNFYTLFKIVGMKKWFWAVICVSLVWGIIYGVYGSDPNGKTVYLATYFFQSVFTLIVDIIYCYRTSKAFHHGLGYTIGLIFLPNLFWLILGFGSSKYDKKFLK